MSAVADALDRALKDHGISATVEEIQHGAAVDRYCLRLSPGVRVAQVTKLGPDIALALGADHVRVTTAGHLVGVEVPARERVEVSLLDLQDGLAADHPLRVPVGLAIDGSGVSARLDRLPHLLVAGTTGSGKSSWTTAILAHLLTHASPAQVQVLLIDPKRVELAPFARVPHLGAPVATDVPAALEVLDGALEEMERRYARMQAAGVRNVADLTDAPPYLVLVVDELADLMLGTGKRAETAIVRLLQVGRAAGIHLILATQRPSADVVTGLIKANTPSRLVFAVQSHTDSGVALGQTGAQALLGAGDALWWPSGASQPERIQGPYVSPDDLDDLLAGISRIEPPAIALPTYADAVGILEGPEADEAAEIDAALEAAREEIRQAEIDAAEAEQLAVTAVADEPEPAVVEPAVVPVPVIAPRHTPAAPAPVVVPPVAEAYTRQDLEHAYAKGRHHGATLAPLPVPSHRPVLAADRWLAAALFLLGAVISFLVLPALPVAAGLWLAYVVTRTRTRTNQWRIGP
ncbi:DNA translocase FtsK [Occultella kanbiaonis]|uniref:DNA translocase FtsK n=1 Tax=Occultella kanbiaonis TaxID=2675754 RepID=UPI00143D601D|nr:DNA translocase FtsK [Occultella kanbiaonis]